MALNQTVDDSLEEFDSLKSNAEKRQYSVNLVREFKAEGGHFWTLESGVWAEADDDVACDKVSHIFRNRRAKKQTVAVAYKKLGNVGSTDGSSDKRVRIG